jgi:short-subunit dehydrogenase
MARFARKVALVTGASSGIGAAVARELARQGADLALVARRLDRLEALASEIRTSGRRALALYADVTRDGDLEEAAARTRDALGGIDLVVANAGFGVVGRFEDLTLDDYRRQLETNVFGVLRTVRATLADLKRSRGCLVIVGSVSGHVSLPGTSPYSMSKFALRAFAEALRHELRSAGVGVVLASPGLVKSELRKVDNRGVLHPAAKEHVPEWLVVPTEKCARVIVRAAARRRREVVITGHGKAAVFLQRHAPWLTAAMVGRGVTGRGEPK